MNSLNSMNFIREPSSLTGEYLRALKKAIFSLMPVLIRVHRVQGVHDATREAVFLVEQRQLWHLPVGYPVAIHVPHGLEPQLAANEVPYPVWRDLPVKILTVAGNETLGNFFHRQTR